MEFNWHEDFFNKLGNSPFNSKEEYSHFKPMFDSLFGELNCVLAELANSDNETDNERYQSYKTILSDWHGYAKRIDSIKDTHFGYHLNLTKRSFLVDFFRTMESFEVMQNNFGDTHDITGSKSSENNYAMDVKSLEWDVVRLIAENLGLPEQPRLVELLESPEKYNDGYWGYVTSGGSESNTWSVMQGFARFPNGIFYFSEGAHFSVPKAALGRECCMIPLKQVDDDIIDAVQLIEKIKSNWLNFKRPAILILTCGTTKYGSVDDIAYVKKQLNELQVPHYLHVDAAFYGGIPRNQEGAPKIGSLDTWGYDSISVSLHKYIGYPNTKGVLISTKKPIVEVVDYIGQMDITVVCSRDIPPFSLRQQVMEIMKYTDPKEYIRCVRGFADMLTSSKIKFKQWSDDFSEGNIFVFRVDKSHSEYRSICRQWQLSEFVSKDNVHLLHVIIFPYHTKDKVELLVNDLAKITVR